MRFERGFSCLDLALVAQYMLVLSGALFVCPCIYDMCGADYSKAWVATENMYRNVCIVFMQRRFGGGFKMSRGYKCLD